VQAASSRSVVTIGDRRIKKKAVKDRLSNFGRSVIEEEGILLTDIEGMWSLTFEHQKGLGHVKYHVVDPSQTEVPARW